MSSTDQGAGPAAESEVQALYLQLLHAWNQRDAAAMAALYTADGLQIGFDGSEMRAAEVEASLGAIFAHHMTAAYVGKVRDIHFLTPEVALLHAVAGMIPPGKTALNPAVNSVQSLLAIKQDGQWRVQLFHNTPAAYHGRPEASAKLSAELQALFDAQGVA